MSPLGRLVSWVLTAACVAVLVVLFGWAASFTLMSYAHGGD